MKSTIVLTLQCLAFSALIAFGCNIAETVNFNFDFSGTKTVEFQYRSLSEDGVTFEDKGDFSKSLNLIDSIAVLMDNISSFKIDTSDQEMAKLSYAFSANDLVIKNQDKYDYFVNRMPKEMQWYFAERPNTFKVLNKNQVRWRALTKSINNLAEGDMEKLKEDLSGISTGSIFNFERSIKDIEPMLTEFELSADRKSLTAEVNLEDILNAKRPNDVIITFE